MPVPSDRLSAWTIMGLVAEALPMVSLLESVPMP